MRRGLKKRETSFTRPAAAIYRAAFNGEPLPRGWRVIRTEKLLWSDVKRYGLKTKARTYIGYCANWKRTIYVTDRAFACSKGRWNPDESGWRGVLIHEFIHQRCPELRHGREFTSLAAAAYGRVVSR